MTFKVYCIACNAICLSFIQFNLTSQGTGLDRQHNNRTPSSCEYLYEKHQLFQQNSVDFVCEIINKLECLRVKDTHVLNGNVLTQFDRDEYRPDMSPYTLETHARSLQKWPCIFPIFHAVVLLDSSN